MRLFVIYYDVVIVSFRNNILWKNYLIEYVCYYFLLKLYLFKLF